MADPGRRARTDHTKLRTIGIAVLALVAGIALAGCMDDGGQEATDPGTDDGTTDDESPSGDGTADDGSGEETGDEDTGSDPLPETELDTPSSWPMVGYTAAQTRSYGGPGDGDPTDAWSTLTGGASAPSVANGFVYATGPGEDDARSTFHAFVPETGDEAWRYHAAVPAGSAVDAERVYVVDGHGQDDTPTALDARTGEVVWTHEEDGFRSDAAPAVLGDRVFFGDGATVVALDASTGEVGWEQGTPSPETPGVTQIMTDDEHVLAGSGGQFLVLDPATGDEVASVDTGERSGDYTVADGRLFVVGLAGTSAWDLESGEELWTYNPGQLVRDHAAVEDGILYLGGSGSQEPGQVIALDAQTGDEEWVVDADGSEVSSPAIAHGTVYVVTQAGNGAEYVFQALHAGNGTEVWSFTFEPASVNPQPPSSPAYVDGMLFTNTGGFIVALDV